MTDLAKLFVALSELAHKENDLSDVTYAMCEADLKFKQFFLDFFFREANLDAHSVKIEREHSDMSGRPDFWITDTDGTIYIVEVKIWNGSHHFDYYDNLNGKKTSAKMRTDPSVWKRLGYIANYESVKDIIVGANGEKAKDLCRVATWRDFHNALSRYDFLGDSVIKAYAEYVKRVCPFDEFAIKGDWMIDMDDFKAVKTFNENVKAVIEAGQEAQDATGKTEVPRVKLCNSYSKRRFRSQQWMGWYFEWTIDEVSLSGKTVWGWLGVRYTNEGAVVCVEFEDIAGWGDLICRRYESDVCDGVVRVFAKDSCKVASGRKALEDFFHGVLRTVSKGEPLENDSFGRVIVPLSVSRRLLAMKCLPFALENHFIDDDFTGKMAENGYEFTFVYGDDEEWQDGHCGRYFELKKKGSGGETTKSKDASDNFDGRAYRCWIGVDYNDECDKVDGGTYGDSPSFTIEIDKEFPAAKNLSENSWGWKCIELCNKECWKSAFRKAKDKLLELVSKT